jgi:hypothetical protein
MYNEKVMETFVDQDPFLSKFKLDNPEMHLKTMFYSFIFGDSEMEKEYLEHSRMIIKKSKNVDSKYIDHVVKFNQGEDNEK